MHWAREARRAMIKDPAGWILLGLMLIAILGIGEFVAKLL
jgi:hypothetical protein